MHALTWQKKSLLLILAAIIFHPLVYTSALGRDPAWLPWRLYEFWRIPQLFTRRVASWPRYHVRVRDASGTWHELPHGQPVEHETYGRMTRLDHVLMMLDFSTHDPELLNIRRHALEKICRDLAASARLDMQGAPITHPVAAVQLVASGHAATFSGAPHRRWNLGRPVDMSAHDTHTIFEQWLDGSHDVPEYRRQLLRENLLHDE